MIDPFVMLNWAFVGDGPVPSRNTPPPSPVVVLALMVTPVRVRIPPFMATPPPRPVVAPEPPLAVLLLIVEALSIEIVPPLVKMPPPRVPASGLLIRVIVRYIDIRHRDVACERQAPTYTRRSGRQRRVSINGRIAHRERERNIARYQVERAAIALRHVAAKRGGVLYRNDPSVRGAEFQSSALRPARRSRALNSH